MRDSGLRDSEREKALSELRNLLNIKNNMEFFRRALWIEDNSED
jgi:hypothetical protein